MSTSQLLTRSGIIIFWLVVITLFLTSPHLGFFQERKSINVCVWSGMFDLQWVARFEKQTGIHVKISYYESNEELLVKLRTKAHGYDLIVPSDYAIYLLCKQDMLKKLDKSKLDFCEHLNPLLMGHYFDKTNEYSVPFEWSVYGLGLNKECYNGVKDKTWGHIFKKKLIDWRKIMMTNDPLIGIPLAALYLFGNIHSLTKEKIQLIENLLRNQHPLVEAYTDLRASYYLASQDACMAVCSSSSIFKAKRQYPHLDFIIPKEGTLLSIENFALPKATNKEELVYIFMNYMMKPESVAHSYEYIGFFPATTDVLPHLSVDPEVRALLTMPKKEFERFHLLRFDQLKKALDGFELQDLWVQIKA